MKRYTQILVASRVNIIMQPVDAEAYDYPGTMAEECQNYATLARKPVILVGKHGDSFEFKPQKSK
jgi:hypothetical protein